MRTLTIRLALASAVLSFVACVASVPRSLTDAQVASLRLQGVNVTVAPDAYVLWAGADIEFAESKGIRYPVPSTTDRETDPAAMAEYVAAHRALQNTDEARRFAREGLISILRDSMQGALASRLNGSQPVRLDVTLRHLKSGNPTIHLLTGNDNELIADVSVIDASSGRAMASYPGLSVKHKEAGTVETFQAGATHRDAYRSMSKLLARRFEVWLLKN